MNSSVEIEEIQLEQLILHSKVPVIIEFMTQRCIICKTMKERLAEVSREFKDRMVWMRIDIENSKLWQKYEIMSTPTLFYYNRGKLAERHTDFPEKEKIRQTLELLLKE